MSNNAELDSSKHLKQEQATPTDVRALWITYLNIVLYALCYQCIQPVEPFLVQSLSKDSADSDSVARRYGQLLAFFSTIQTIGSPLVGIMLDRIGVRKASAIVFAASAVSYAILASAKDMRLLFLSKIPTALQHAFLVAQATAATSTRGNEGARAAALARMTTAYTIGATVGPTLGGILASHGDLYSGARLAVLGSLVSMILSLLFLPDTSGSKNQLSKKSFRSDIQHQARLALQASLFPLLIVKVAGGITSSMHSTALPLVLTQELHFPPALLGFAMSSSMLAVATFGAVVMAPLTKLLGSNGLTHYGLVARVLWGGLLAFLVTSSAGASHPTQIIILTSVLRELSSHALATGLTTQTTGAVSTEEQGALLGLEHGLFSLARIVGPPLGTFLLTRMDTFWAVATACSCLDISLIALLMRYRDQINSGQKSKSK